MSNRKYMLALILLVALSTVHARTQKMYLAEQLQIRIVQPHGFEITEDSRDRVRLRSHWQEKRPGMEVYETHLFGVVLRRPVSESIDSWQKEQIQYMQSSLFNVGGAYAVGGKTEVKQNSVKRYTISKEGFTAIRIVEYRHTQPPWYCAIGYRPLTEQVSMPWVFMRLCQLGLNPEISSLTKALYGVTPLD